MPYKEGQWVPTYEGTPEPYYGTDEWYAYQAELRSQGLIK